MCRFRPVSCFVVGVPGRGMARNSFRLSGTARNQNENDLFAILGMSEPSADAKEIKRAYRRMAMKYHPDVVLSDRSTEAERKEASERFARINAAYAVLSGKDGSDNPSTKSSSSSSSSSGTGYTPPHRRASTSGTGVDWTDFIRNDDDDDDRYDTGGDSFSSIFADFVAGMSAGSGVSSRGAGGVVRDLVDFLERNVDGFAGNDYGSTNDPGLNDVLRNGSREEVKAELEDTELLVRQLRTKVSDLTDQAERQTQARTSSTSSSSSYAERIDAEESSRELQARLEVAEGYLGRARKRLLRLQDRYRALRNASNNDYNDNDSAPRSNTDRDRRQSSTAPVDDFSTASSSSSYTSKGTNATTASTSSSSSSSSSSNWRREGFGSSGRGRGRTSSRGGARRPRTGTTSTSTSRTTPSTGSTATPSSPATRDASDRLQTSLLELETTPPHRRRPSQEKTVRESRERLNKLKIEEDFERLKREMGL